MFYVIYFVTGFLAGIIGGLLGTGGCALMMPVIRFGFHFDPALAVGTTLTAVVFTAASGAVQHLRMKNVDGKTAATTGISGVFGVIIGSVVFGYIKDYGSLIDLIIGIAFIIVSVKLLFEGLMGKVPSSEQSPGVPGSNGAKAVLGSSIGFLTGIIGLGGGYALVPSYIYFLRSPVKIAIGTSMAAFVWMALVGSAFKLYQGSGRSPRGGHTRDWRPPWRHYRREAGGQGQTSCSQDPLRVAVSLRFAEIHLHLLRRIHMKKCPAQRGRDMDPWHVMPVEAVPLILGRRA